MFDFNIYSSQEESHGVNFSHLGDRHCHVLVIIDHDLDLLKHLFDKCQYDLSADHGPISSSTRKPVNTDHRGQSLCQAAQVQTVLGALALKDGFEGLQEGDGSLGDLSLLQH